MSFRPDPAGAAGDSRRLETPLAIPLVPVGIGLGELRERAVETVAAAQVGREGEGIARADVGPSGRGLARASARAGAVRTGFDPRGLCPGRSSRVSSFRPAGGPDGPDGPDGPVSR
ncbi:hypothetical protein GCM10027162_16960 [Streptomyces incanus]